MHLHTHPVCFTCFAQGAESHLCLDLVGSTLSDPYISYSASLFALAGPLHGWVHGSFGTKSAD